MGMKRKIGGDFEIQPDVFSEFSFELDSQTDKISYASGRHALLSIIKYLKAKGKTTIYLPNFLCESVVKTVLSENLEISFYTIKENLTIELEIDELIPNSIFLVINYFGLTDHNSLIEKIKSTRPDIITICDCVPAFYDMEDSNADFSFNSFRKFFPIPEGAYINAKVSDFNSLENLPESNFQYLKIIGSILKNNKINDQSYLSFFKNGEIELDNLNGIYKASNLFFYLSEKTDFDNIKNRRRKNAEVIYELCHKNKLELISDLKSKKNSISCANLC